MRRKILPREKRKLEGIEALSIEEIIALLLGHGSDKKDVFSLAREITVILSEVNVQEPCAVLERKLQTISGLQNRHKEVLFSAIELGKRLFLEKPHCMITPSQVVLLFHSLCKSRQEKVYGVYLNNALELIKKQLLFKGTGDTTLCNPREVFLEALRCRARYMIIVHNHPSGRLEPSVQDKNQTMQLVRAGEIIGISVVDHLIVGRTGHFSFKENGLL